VEKIHTRLKQTLLNYVQQVHRLRFTLKRITHSRMMHLARPTEKMTQTMLTQKRKIGYSALCVECEKHCNNAMFTG
jgi:hypothetical protein